MKLDISLDRLGAEKKDEVVAVVKEWLDCVEISYPDELSEHITIEIVEFHAVVDGVPVKFSTTVS